VGFASVHDTTGFPLRVELTDEEAINMGKILMSQYCTLLLQIFSGDRQGCSTNTQLETVSPEHIHLICFVFQNQFEHQTSSESESESEYLY